MQIIVVFTDEETLTYNTDNSYDSMHKTLLENNIDIHPATLAALHIQANVIYIRINMTYQMWKERMEIIIKHKSFLLY